MNRIIAVIFAVFFATVAFANLPTPTPTVETLNGIVAVVNNEVITKDEFNAALAQAKQQLAASQNPAAISTNKLKQMVLRQLIDQKLQLQMAERAGIKITDAQVDKAIANLAKMNKMSVAQLKEKLEKDHVPFSQYRALIHKQLMVHQVQETAVSSTVRVTQADLDHVQAMYQAQMGSHKQYEVIDIVAQTKSSAENMVAQLRKNPDIEKITTADSVNDMGWKSASELPSLFLHQLTQMKPGDIAGPISAPNGYHVIKLVAVRGHNAKSLPPAALQNYAYNLQMQKAVDKWISKLRSTAYIRTEM